MSAMYSFIRAYLTETNRKKLLFYCLFYVACTLAFYTKGFIGIVIPGLSILIFLIIERNFREIIRMRLWLGVLIFLATDVALVYCPLAAWRDRALKSLFPPQSSSKVLSQRFCGDHIGGCLRTSSSFLLLHH